MKKFKVLLQIIGAAWAFIGAAVILMNPSVLLTAFNIILFVFPGLVLCGLGSVIGRAQPKVKGQKI